jgi:transmembrane sensor
LKADNQHTDKDELLVKYLAGEADADERAEAELWIEAGAENRKYYEHFKLLWDESQKLAHSSVIDEDVAWNHFRERIQKEYITTTKPKINIQWLKVAAVFLLVSAAALWMPYFLTRKDDTRYTSAADTNTPVTILKSFTTDNTRVDTLPDGSVITLNKNTRLDYPAAFTGHTRNVQLNGEAFFNVKHDPDKPFVIKVNDVSITVLGTSFNVNSRDGKTEVIVETGMVSVQKNDEKVTLHAGEKTIAFNNENTFKKELNRDTLYREYVYKQHAYAFRGTARANTDTSFDINKHPDMLKQILKDPSKWPGLLKKYTPMNENIKIRRTVIREVIAEMVKEKIIAGESIRSFRLNENELIINDKRQTDAVHQRFKEKFLKEPGFTIYFGGAPGNGKGVFLSPDSL